MALPPPTSVGGSRGGEWFIADHFTALGGRGPLYVEWVRARGGMDLTTTASVTVVTRRLAARGDDPYQRLDEEAWEVVTELTDDGWTVAAGRLPHGSRWSRWAPGADIGMGRCRWPHLARPGRRLLIAYPAIRA